MQKLLNPFLTLQRKLLSAWVKTTVLPGDIDTLGLSPPLFYILETRSLSNLLVLEQQCIELGLPRPTQALQYGSLQLPRAASTLRQRPSLWQRKPGPLNYSQTLRDLFEYARQHPQDDLQLVPVTLFWGRQPDKDHGWFKLLFADSWSKVGRLRKFFIILAHGRDTWLQFSQPVSLQAFSDPDSDIDKNIRKLSRVLRVHFRQLRSAAIGPELSNRQTVVRQVLAAPNVRQAIQSEMQEQGLSATRATAQARRYVDEIAADFSYPFILLMRRVLRRLWDRLYNGVVVHHSESLRQIAPGHTLVYLPCHRSHIDYLLLSYVLDEEGLAIPYIAAGLNLNIPLIGPWLRRGGAFFLRRSFRGKPLYRAVFHAYLTQMLTRGTALEYFIEGGRSRTGRSLPPKLGMLDMTVRSFLHQPKRPLVFVPVYIGYEKLVEGRSYLAELSGQAKRKESLLGFFRGLRALRSDFGQVHLNFGEPLNLGDYLDHFQADWQQHAYPLAERPDWLPPLVDKLAAEIMLRMNAAADVNAVNLLALALLSTPNQAMDERELSARIDCYRQLLSALSYSPRFTLSAPAGPAVIAHGLQLGLLTRRPNPLGDIILAHEEQALLLSYFRNNVLHIMAMPGLLACCLRGQARRETEIQHLIELAYPFLQSELFLPWQCDELPTVVTQALQAMQQQGLLEHSAAGWRTAYGNPHLHSLADSISPMLERYYLTTTVLLQAGSGQLQQTQLEQRSQQLAQRMALLFGLRTPDYYDRSLFHTFLQTLQQTGLVQSDQDGRLCFATDIAQTYRPLWQLLSPPIRHSIAALTGGQNVCP